MGLAFYAKAVAAFIVSLAGGFEFANSDRHVTGSEWQYIIVTSVVAAAAVFSVPNSVGSRTRTPPNE